MPAPKRKRKDDRLFHPGAGRVEITSDIAVAPFDRKAREMDLKWGIDRLPELVTPETAKKYGAAMANLNAALDINDADEVAVQAHVCIKGMEFMDAEAERIGSPKSDPAIIEYDLDGYVFGVMRDGEDWMAAAEKRPDLKIFTMREVGLALKAVNTQHDLIEAAKAIGGEIVDIREKADRKQNDAIPF